MQLKKGLLTIGLPTYNGGANLPELIASAKNLGLAQDKYEILVVDNNSTDDTANIINDLKPGCPNLTYYRNDYNIGRIENWNKVLKLTNSEYLLLMNANDRFLKFDASHHLKILDECPDIGLLMTNIQSEDYIYPNWVEEGLIDLEAYIKKTFLDSNYLEFNSLGVLQQHIFRTQTINDHNLRFDLLMPRTTDRVFAAQVIKHGGGKFYYSPQTMVNWQLNKNRYHYNVHVSHSAFNFDELWVDEYRANIQVGRLVNISYTEILKGQLIYASFLMLAKWLRHIKYKLFNIQTDDNSMEVPTANIYYEYLKTMAQLNRVSINYLVIKLKAFRRAFLWFLRSVKLYKANKRSLKNLNNYTGNYDDNPLISEYYV